MLSYAFTYIAKVATVATFISTAEGPWRYSGERFREAVGEGLATLATVATVARVRYLYQPPSGGLVVVAC